MTPQDFVKQVIRPALIAIGLDSPEAESLLLGTAIQESRLRNITQVRGPAVGYFQIEPATEHDVWVNFLAFKPTLAERVRGLLPPNVEPGPGALMGCPQYAAAIARLIYYRVPDPIPAGLDEQAAYYKRWFNTPGGAATVAEYLANWQAAHQAVA